MQILLQKTASGQNWSLESGLVNGQNFDHHKPEHRGCKSPANNTEIPVAPEGAIIEISHLDADTYVGLLRLTGRSIPSGIDLDLLEQIDLNGSSVCSDKYNPTLLYMVGIGVRARELKFPRCGEEPQDVTAHVEELFNMSEEDFVFAGQDAQGCAEQAYRECKMHGLPLWVVGPDDAFDPSRPYEDGYPVVVVYRSHYESISIYCDPGSEYAFGGKTIAGILFAGHPKAAGSPRGEAMTVVQAMDVAQKIQDVIVNGYSKDWLNHP